MRSNRLLTSAGPNAERHGDDHYYIRRSGIHGRLVSAICSGVNGGITRQRDGPPLTTATLFSTGMMQNGLPPRIDLVIGFNGERLAGPGRMCYVLTKDPSPMLGIRCCI